MSESQLISDLRAALDEMAGPVRVPADAAERARTSARRRRMRRRVGVAVPTAGLAAGLAFAVNAPSVPGAPAVAQLTAAGVLHHAAAAALTRPAVVPRPGQFIYWKTADSSSGITQAWRSVDGSRNGFVLSAGSKTILWGCRDGWQTIQPDPGSGMRSLTQRCTAQPAYLKSAPETPAQMQAYLVSTFGFSTENAAVAEKVTEYVLSQCYLRPAQQAAMFGYFATLPGLKVIPHARDYAGRQGTGVSFTSGGSTAMWVFDPKTFALLGSTDLTGGKVIDSTAVLQIAIANRAGQRP